jgi:hypothetical protein
MKEEAGVGVGVSVDVGVGVEVDVGVAVDEGDDADVDGDDARNTHDELDQHTAGDEEVLEFIKSTLLPLINTTETFIYIHCRGGMGRTGTIVALLLGMYEVSLLPSSD